MQPLSPHQAIYHNFLGDAPSWYKNSIIFFLLANPILLQVVGPYITGWILILQFIFTLAMALKCYPLQSGGLLAIEAIFLGMASAKDVYHEIQLNLPVILLLVFMVAGIYFMKDLLLFTFTKLLTSIRSKTLLALLFSFVAAFLSAFLDALTVIAVVISVGVGFYTIFQTVSAAQDNDLENNEKHQKDLEQFRGFLRDLMMHAAVGTALGGVCTMVGEPQNLVIAAQSGWQFAEFFWRMSPVSIPVLITGLTMVVVLEKTAWFGYGWQLPESVRDILVQDAIEQDAKRDRRANMTLIIQAVVAVWLVVALALHLAEVGIIGLSVIVLTTAFNGVTNEHAIGKAFEEALPFTALLVVFFAIVAVIDKQGLFKGVIDNVLQMENKDLRTPMFYLANGLLSAISDNVFVGTVYINELKEALLAKRITREEYDLLAVAINTGTNIPSVATPNGQAAFLFLLTSSLAPLIRLGYGTMVYKAIPYTISLTIVGLLSVIHLLPNATEALNKAGLFSDSQESSELTVPTHNNGHH